MRKLIAILAVALAIPTMSFALGEGRYQGVDPNEGDGIWIVDTKLGEVKYCSYLADHLVCDPWSTDRKDFLKLPKE